MQKPVVNIKDCSIVHCFGGDLILTGIPLDYPEEHQFYSGAVKNNRKIYTSAIVSREDNTVETLRTIYKVQNWIEL
jgi:NADH:ubiquinone oxidoreductase subunit C